MIVRLAVGCLALWLVTALGALGGVTAQEQQEQVVRSFWRTACSTDAAGAWRCRMTRSVPKPNGQGALMQLVISRNQSNGKPEVQADFIVPIAVHLPSGVQIATEKGKWLKVAYARCSPSACVASFKVDNALLKQLKSGSQLDVRFFMREDQPVGVAIDLKGFTAAFEKLQKK